MTRRAGWIFVALLCATVALGRRWGHAAEPDAARVLLDQVRELNRTTRKWSDSTQRLTVTIYTRRGSEKQQEMELMTKKYGEDASRTVVLFREPPDIRGMAVLQWVEPHEPNQTWLYSPELKRPRQISGTSQRDSFSGTDFSYEDLSIRGEIADWTPDEASASLSRDEELDGHPCAVIEIVPKTVDVSYEKIRVWLGRDDLVVHKFEFDESGRLVKTLVMSDVRVLGKVPTAHRLEMKNERTGSRTVVVFDHVAYDTGLKDALFHKDYLEQRS